MEKLIKLGALSLAFLVVGCASPGPDYQSPISDYEHQGVRLNANIEETPDGWAFTDITEETLGAEVRLDTLEYVGTTSPSLLDEYDLGYEGANDWCAAGIYGLTDGTCNDRKFAGAKVTGDVYLASVLGTPFLQTFGVFVAPALAMQGDVDVFVLPLFTTREFKWGDYVNAAEEAKETNNFSQRFPPAYDLYVSLKKSIDAYSIEDVPESNVSETRSAIDDKWESTKSDLLREVDNAVEVSIIDESGLAPENLNELTADDLLTYSEEFVFDKSPFKEKLKHRATEELGLKTVSADFNSAFDDISDMESHLDTLEKDFEEAKRHNEAHVADARQMRKSDNQFNRQVLDNVKKELDSTTLKRDYDAHWNVDFTDLADLNFKFDIPETTTISAAGNHSGENIDVIIESVDIDHRLSPSASERAGGLEISLEDDLFKITNTTDDYITIHSVSLYYDDQVLTRSRKNSSSLYEIAPTSEKSTWLSDVFDVSDLQTEFSRMTAEKARNTNLTYGVSMRYTVSGSGRDATIKMVDGYNLYSLLQEEDGWR